VARRFGVQPKLADHGVDGETDPERNPGKKLVRAKMCASARGEKILHDRTSGCDTEQDSHRGGSSTPAVVRARCGKRKPVGSAQRQQIPCVEDEDRGALDPASDRVGAHRIRGYAGDGTEGKRRGAPAMCRWWRRSRTADGEKHEDGRWDDMHRGEHGVKREGLRRAPPIWRGACRARDGSVR